MQSDDDRTGRPEVDEAPQLPEELIRGLKRFDKAVAVISPDADRRVVEAARTHFGKRPLRARTAGRRWAMAGSLAASLLVGVVFWRMQTPVEDARLAPVARVASVGNVSGDIDGSGAVDILDAFALARMARGGHVTATQAKPDARARVAATDRTPAMQARIDALAMSIVALNGSARKL